jgi:hypothetical protein
MIIARSPSRRLLALDALRATARSALDTDGWLRCAVPPVEALRVSAAARRQPATNQPDIGLLKSNFGFKGRLFRSSDPGFEQAAYGRLWNKLQPKRHPQIVAQAADVQDVVAAVKFARANKLKVTVRGGGHNWCNPSLRDNGLLIDVTNLNRVLSIDSGVQKAIVQPIVSNRQI